MNIETKEIRTLKDYEAIKKIANDIWPKTYKELLSKEQIIYMMKMMYDDEVFLEEIAKGYIWELVTIDGEDAGFISYSKSAEAINIAELHKVYLLDKFHGNGVGAFMQKHAINQCRNLGYKYIQLHVNKYNKKAQKSYLANGFYELKTLVTDIGNNYIMDDYILQYDL